MTIYRLLKIAGLKSVPGFAKLLGLYYLIATRKRFLGVFFDPMLSCNLRCKMCYFSNPEKREDLHGVVSTSTIDDVRRLLLPYAMKFQIGCGAEPTLFPQLKEMVKTAREAKVPYISLTTNGQLIGSGKTDLNSLVEAGLSEITLSLHATNKEDYEDLMPGAHFDILMKTLNKIGEVKRRWPDFAVRVNFVVNSQNYLCLKENNFFDIWDKCGLQPDIIQLRPVQKIGETEWTDFDNSFLQEEYESTVGNVVKRAKERGIRCLFPSLKELETIDSAPSNSAALMEDISYCYVSPRFFYKDDFDPSDTLFSYHRRKKTKLRLLRSIFRPDRSHKKDVTKKLNYRIS